jgi:hypothetical protein
LDHGKLQHEVEEPKMFLADRSHHTIVYGGGVYSIVKTTKPIHNRDAQQQQYFGYCIKCYNTETLSCFAFKMMAVLEHSFNNHWFCDIG